MSARTQRKPHDQGADPASLTWGTIRARLEHRRTRISREISADPAPIAACDAHINQLLADRERISEELARLDAARDGGDAKALEDFIQSSAFLKNR